MSSLATFYLLPEAKRSEFTEAHRNQKRVTYKRTLFGQREIVTGDRFLWEYLDSDSVSVDRVDFPFSGFAFIDYFLTFVAQRLPKDLESALAEATMDDHYFTFSAELAARLAAYLRSHPPDVDSLSVFASEHDSRGGAEYIQMLGETHDFLLAWFDRVVANTFGVLHLTF
jgi:hypothetical protein